MLFLIIVIFRLILEVMYFVGVLCFKRDIVKYRIVRGNGRGEGWGGNRSSGEGKGEDGGGGGRWLEWWRFLK